MGVVCPSVSCRTPTLSEIQWIFFQIPHSLMGKLGRFILGKSFGSLEKAIDILCLFESEHLELSAQEIADRLSIPLSTTYKYLQVFKNKQFLSKNDQTNQFFLGLTILKLGLLAAKKTPVMKIASPYLKLLSDRSLETAILVVGDGQNAICADIIESPRAVKFMTAKGHTMPLYAGAPGKTLLAFKDPAFIDQLIETTGLAKLNKNTITDSEKLKRNLADIRRLGYSESDSEFESDVCSVAAPIFDYKGQVIASISVAGPAERIFRENKERLIDLVKESANRISSELGYGKTREEKEEYS
ncbi:MAG: Transcriptional regulator, IclR family [uncultured bacterium]|nr:MAG: Transcriptional regulator, IclR family [uncultured bacterium]